MPIRMKPVSKAKRKRPTRAEMDQRGRDALDYLDEYLEGNIEEPMQWLTRFWGTQQAALRYADLVALARNEPNAEGIFKAWYQEYANLINTRMTPLWEQSMMAAVQTSPFLPLDRFVFNGTEEAVLDWMRNRTGNLITVVTQEQINAVRYISLEGRSRKLSSDETARYIRAMVGLTRPQAAANLKLYESVKQKLQDEHPRMKQESVERKAREAAAKYAVKQQKYRAETIARTEMAFSYCYGEDAAVKQAMAQGLLPRMRRKWITAKEHVCTACEDLEGLDIGMGEDEYFWTTVRNNPVTVVLPPLHPRCQCVIEYIEETGEDGKVIWDVPPADERETHDVPDRVLPEYDDMRMQEYTGDHYNPRVTPEVRRAGEEESKEYSFYREILGVNAPKTLDEFRAIKYANGELWNLMQLDLRRRKDLLDHPELALPNANSVEIDDRKFSDYLFNKNNLRGWAKGMAFESRLGYSANNWHLLKEELVNRASFYPASDRGITPYGHKYQQRIVVYGMKGTPANVEVGWIVNNDNHTVMTSAYINEVKKDEY